MLDEKEEEKVEVELKKEMKLAIGVMILNLVKNWVIIEVQY